MLYPLYVLAQEFCRGFSPFCCLPFQVLGKHPTVYTAAALHFSSSAANQNALIGLLLIYSSDKNRPRYLHIFRSAGAGMATARQLPTNLCTHSHVPSDRVDGAQVHETPAAVLLQRPPGALQSGPHTPLLLHVLWGKQAAWHWETWRSAAITAASHCKQTIEH